MQKGPEVPGGVDLEAIATSLYDTANSPYVRPVTSEMPSTSYGSFEIRDGINETHM